MKCLDFHRARQLMLLSGLFLFIFAVAFLAVGGGSLALGERFTTTVEAYCTKHCGAVEDGVRRREDGTGERRVDADQRERRREGQEDEPRAPIHPFLDSKPSRGDDPQRRNGGGEEETGRRVEAQEGEAEQIVGCDCSTSPPSPSIPTQFLLAPPIGLIVIGAFTLACSLLACCVSFPAKRDSVQRKQHRLTLLLLLLLPLIILVHLVFAFVSLTLATGAVSPGFIAPFAKSVQYKLFDWREFASVFPEECYAGTNAEVVVGVQPVSNTPIRITFHHPLCRFYGACEDGGSAEELACCNAHLACDTHKSECKAGFTCLRDFLTLLATPVAAVSFTGLCFELLALLLLCVLRSGSPVRDATLLGGGAGGGGGANVPASDDDL
eukprot:CAMPEP_0177700154 /NCGR_PEP_ID=MMETSP0484_2-20121128/5950_1 /TAXON_ID=354590 /ORGANISM="Rhodomonas lens, Strain RHODO" /LENGTH=380 /DNA_ID=CAMNT_0019211349 /DNA_START=19 /DNA_END=1161 /DNA_ORIENTATION=-